MNISKISYSSWKDYQKCQYYYLQKHVKGIRLPFIGTVHSAFGVSIHYVLEKTIPNKMERALANQIFLTKFDEELLKSKVILPNKDEWIQKANKILDNFWLKHFNKLKNNVYKTEWKFKIPMLENKYIIVGIIDHCTFTKAGGIGVIDYKTGKSHKPNEQNAMQLSMYSLAIEKSLNLIPEWFCLMYLEHDENQFSYRTEKENRETEAKLNGFYNNIIQMKEEDFKPNLNSCYNFCDFKNQCPHRCGDSEGNGTIV